MDQARKAGPRMTPDEFLLWDSGDDRRYEPVAGEVVVSGALLHDWLPHGYPALYMAAPWFGAVGVVSVGLPAIRAMRIADGASAAADADAEATAPTAPEVACSAEDAR